MRTSIFSTIPVLGAVALWMATPFVSMAGDEDGVAVAILYDSSGSMRNLVQDADGKRAPKYLIAKRSVDAIVKRLQAYVASASPGSPRKLSVGLYAFHGKGAQTVVPLAPFNSKQAAKWSNRLPAPSTGTPIGTALETASKALLKSNLPRKHILVITDGENTVGPDPITVLPGLKAQAANQKTDLKVHFVAFDVDAKVFAPLKQLGVKVVSAANESQLNTQLQIILQKDILLEDPDPPRNK